MGDSGGFFSNPCPVQSEEKGVLDNKEVLGKGKSKEDHKSHHRKHVISPQGSSRDRSRRDMYQLENSPHRASSYGSHDSLRRDT